jgi:hypothetical protein
MKYLYYFGFGVGYIIVAHCLSIYQWSIFSHNVSAQIVGYLMALVGVLFVDKFVIKNNS